jgi:hypothetical protein
MNRKRAIFMVCLAMWSVFLLASCQRNQLNKDTSASEDNNTAQSLWDDVGDQVDGTYSLDESDSLFAWNNCATIRIDTLGSPFPILFTIDFGEVNCECVDGRLRRGSIIYESSGPFRLAGTVVTVTTDDYYVNDYRVEGSRITTNLGNNAQGFPHFSIAVIEGMITTPNDEMISWESNRVRTWIEGSETGFFTPDTINGGFLGWEGILDDVFEISGTAIGTSIDGRTFSAEITDPLRAQLDCKWITKGTIALIPDELLARTIDYGDGNCDKSATVTIGNKTYDITLRD